MVRFEWVTTPLERLFTEGVQTARPADKRQSG